MNLMEYVQKLIQNGTWGKLSGDAHSILLYIIAKARNEPIQLTYSAVAKDLGISVNTAKKHLKILIKEGLLIFDEGAKTYKPAAVIDNTGVGLPMPPSDPSVPPDENVDIFEWAKEFMNSPWGALIGGAIIGYIIRLWIEYIESQNDVNDPFSDWPTFFKPDPYKHLKLNETISWLEKNKNP